MRVNGGVIGAANESTTTTASGVWGWAERQMRERYNKFPGVAADFESLANVTYLRNQIGLDAAVLGVFFKPDGTRFFSVGSSADDVETWVMSTPWDVSTAVRTYAYVVNAQENAPTGVSFKSDGTKMYVVGNLLDSIVEYDLSTPWTPTTGSVTHVGNSITVGVNPRDIAFKPDGTVVYIVLGSSIDQYTLGTAWDVSTITSAGSFITNAVPYITVGASGVSFSTDGTKMFILSQTGQRAIFTLTLSTPWDVTTASVLYPSELYRHPDVSSEDTAPQGLFMDASGTRVYMVGSSTDDIYQYELTTPYVLTDDNYIGETSFFAETGATIKGFFVSTDGTKLHVLRESLSVVYEYDLSVPHDISSATYTTYNSGTVSTRITGVDAPVDIFIKPDGTQMFFLDDTNEVATLNLTTPWSFATTPTNASRSFIHGITSPHGLTFSNDGFYMYITERTTQLVNAYVLSTAWDVRTATKFATADFTRFQRSTGVMRNVSFNNNGTKLFVNMSNRVIEFNLAQPHSVVPQDIDPNGNKSYDFGRYFGYLSGATEAQMVRVDVAGNKVYVVDQDRTNIHQIYIVKP